MKIIDIDKWNRKIIYKNFICYDNPVFSISARLDVTPLYDYCKAHGLSFFTTFMFIAAKCLNGIDEFRLRLKGGKVVLYEKINPSFIVKRADGVITTCVTPITESFTDFYDASRRADAEARTSDRVRFNDTDANDVYFITCMPWVDIVSFANPYDLKNADATSIPRLMWSKFVDECGRKKMTFDVSAHHALIDGEPVCRGINAIQHAIYDAENFLK